MNIGDSYASGWLVTAALVLLGVAILKFTFYETTARSKPN